MSYYDEESGITYMTESEYETCILEPLRSRLYDAILDFHGAMYEEGYAGYPRSSQSLNIDNTFATVAEQLAPYAMELLENNDLGMIVEIEP